VVSTITPLRSVTVETTNRYQQGEKDRDNENDRQTGLRMKKKK